MSYYNSMKGGANIGESVERPPASNSDREIVGFLETMLKPYFNLEFAESSKENDSTYRFEGEIENVSMVELKCVEIIRIDVHLDLSRISVLYFPEFTRIFTTKIFPITLGHAL